MRQSMACHKKLKPYMPDFILVIYFRKSFRRCSFVSSAHIFPRIQIKDAFIKPTLKILTLFQVEIEANSRIPL